MAESFLLAKNLKLHFDKLQNINFALILVIQIDDISLNILQELQSNLDSSLREKHFGYVEPLHTSNLEITFTVFLLDLDKGLQLVIRVIREFGVYFNTKIIMCKPEYKILKPYS